MAIGWPLSPGYLFTDSPRHKIRDGQKFVTLPAGRFRHKDHRFEWTRAEFQAWAQGVARRFGYAVAFSPVGPEDTLVGAPTQMAVFTQAV